MYLIQTLFQQAAVYTQPPAIRPRPHFRPLAPVSSARVQPIGTPRIASSKTTPPSTEVVYPQISQQSQPSMHLNVNGKCIVCSKFALYLCSKCQQFWYCSPQCQVGITFLYSLLCSFDFVKNVFIIIFYFLFFMQLKHWVTHQHNCKNSSNVSQQNVKEYPWSCCCHRDKVRVMFFSCGRFYIFYVFAKHIIPHFINHAFYLQDHLFFVYEYCF